MARYQCQGIAVDLRNVEKDLLSRNARGKRYEERLRDVGVCSKERSNLVASPAGTHRRIAAYLVTIDCGERMASRPVDPALQKFAARCGKVVPIVGIDTFEWKSARLDDAFLLRKIDSPSLET